MMNEHVPKKSLGQHWLYDKTSLGDVVNMAGVKSGDLVLEVGPGKGTLTDALLERGARVLAVELDDSLAIHLAKRYKNQEVLIINESILEFDFGSITQPYKVVANIPYYLTSHLVRILSELPNRPERVSLLVQKEVAERICAKPGDMSILSATAQYYWQVKLGEIVESYLFEPPPKVDSQVVGLFRKSLLDKQNIDQRVFFKLVKAGFSSRRKKLINSLSSGLKSSKQDTMRLIESSGLNPEQRPQDLSVDDWLELYKAYSKA